MAMTEELNPTEEELEDSVELDDDDEDEDEGLNFLSDDSVPGSPKKGMPGHVRRDLKADKKAQEMGFDDPEDLEQIPGGVRVKGLE